MVKSFLGRIAFGELGEGEKRHDGVFQQAARAISPSGGRVSFGLPAWLLLAIIPLAVGCGEEPTVPTGETAANIRQLAIGYVQYAAKNRGAGPADQETLATFVATTQGIPKEEVDKYFTSPRDNEPLVILWGLRPTVPDPAGFNPPKPNVIIHEKTGAGGTIIVANGQLSVQEMSPDEFAQVAPANGGS